MFEINSKEYWNERFESGDWNQKNGREQSSFFYKLMLDNFPKWLFSDIEQNLFSICDLGSAEGEGVNILSNRFKTSNVSGCDFSLDAVKKAKKNYPKCNFFCQDINLFNREYDVLISSNVLEHFSNPKKIIQNIIKFCRKYLIILVPFKEYERLDEHLFTFDYKSFPIKINNFFLTYYKEIFCDYACQKYWNGCQLLVIYERINNQNFENLTLDKIENKNFDEIIVLGNKILQKKHIILNLEEKIKNNKNIIDGLKEINEEQRNTIMQIQFEARQFKQDSLDAKETYVWKTGAKIESFFKKTGIYLICSMLEASDFKRVGLFLTIRKILNEIRAKKKIGQKEKNKILNIKNDFENKSQKINIDFSKINFFKKKDLVSIIIKVSRKQNNEETIKSIIKQSYKNFELILFFDELSDKSHEKIAKYIQMDERIIIRHNNFNEKLGESINGEYVTWIEPGFVLNENCLEKLKKEINEEKNIGMVFDEICLNQKNKRSFKIRDNNSKNSTKNFFGVFLYRAEINKILEYDLFKNYFNRYEYLNKINFLFKSKHIKNKDVFYKNIYLKNLLNQNAIKNCENWYNFPSKPNVWLVSSEDEEDEFYKNFIKKMKNGFNIIIEEENFKLLKNTLAHNVNYVNFGKKINAKDIEELKLCFTKTLVNTKEQISLDFSEIFETYDIFVTTKNINCENIDLKNFIYIKDEDALISFLTSKIKILEKNLIEKNIKNIKNEYKVSIIMCTYERKEKLTDALWSVVRQSFSKKDYEIIIVDNSPLFLKTKEVAFYFKNKYPEYEGFIKYVAVLPKGLSYARNEGIRNAKGEILLFLDDDVLADYHLIEEIFSAFKHHENTGVVGGQIILDIPFPKPEIIKAGSESLWSQLKVQYSTYKAVSQHFELPYGANYAVRRNVAMKIGGFDTNYGRTGNDYAGGEEIVFSFKAMKMGYEIGIEPRAKVLHLIDKSRFNEEHVRKTIKSVILTIYKLQQDSYVDFRWTKRYVKNQIKILKKEILLFKKKRIDAIDIFYKKCSLSAWKEVLKIMEIK